MGHIDEAGAQGCNVTQRIAQLDGRAEVQTVGGFVEQQGARLVDERTANHHALGLARGHGVDGLVPQMLGMHQPQHFLSAGFHGVGDGMLGPQLEAGIVAGQDYAAAGGALGTRLDHLVGHDRDQFAHVVDMPVGAAEHLHHRTVAPDRMVVTHHRANQGGLARAVRANDGQMLAARDRERHAV